MLLCGSQPCSASASPPPSLFVGFISLAPAREGPCHVDAPEPRPNPVRTTQWPPMLQRVRHCRARSWNAPLQQPFAWTCFAAFQAVTLATLDSKQDVHDLVQRVVHDDDVCGRLSGVLPPMLLQCLPAACCRTARLRTSWWTCAPCAGTDFLAQISKRRWPSPSKRPFTWVRRLAFRTTSPSCGALPLPARVPLRSCAG